MKTFTFFFVMWFDLCCFFVVLCYFVFLLFFFFPHVFSGVPP